MFSGLEPLPLPVGFTASAYPEIPVPVFARLTDYFGPWCYEPQRFFALWEMVKGTDLNAHMAASPPRPATTTRIVPGRAGKSIAVMGVEGMLMKGQPSFGGTSTVQLRRDIRQAVADPNVSGIMLAIDSPGGTAAGNAEVAQEIRDAKKKKPVWAQVTDLGASAAYYIASQADMIFANTPSAQVGSIGTVQMIYDSSGQAEKEGVKVLRFATGPLKGIGAPGAAVTDEQQAHIQGLVNGMQAGFDQAVRTGRGISAAQLESVKTGGVFLAPEAKTLGLIDGIQSFDKTLSALASAM